MKKAPEAFRTISEAADALDLPQHVLRFWETRFTQVKPMKRAGGRRYYRPEDIELLAGIKALLYDRGYTIKGVQKLLKERGQKHVTTVGAGGEGEAPPPAPAPEVPDVVVGASPGSGGARESLSGDDRALLQEVLLDMLECKRVLDQAR